MPNSKKTQSGKVPTTAIGRAARLLGAGAALIGREVAVRSLDAVSALSDESRLKKRLNQAAGLVESLSQLKGAAMKTGQLLSLEFSDLLPPEITDILRKLHDSSTFMPFDQVQKILRRELGPELFRELEDLSVEPISAASIGQVHSATLAGQKVAVKIQFPGVDQSIKADLALVRKAVESVLWVQSKNVPLDGFFEECERVLRQEVDYLKEAQFINQYSDFVKGSDCFLVPKVFASHSTSRVLTLSFMEGERLGEWMKKSRTEVETFAFAKIILELLFSEFFEWGVVQTDPNFGNFLYRPATKQLVLLDFGACNIYKEDLRKDMLGLLKAAFSKDKVLLLKVAAESGVLDPRESGETKELFCRMMELIVSVFREESQPFNFSSGAYLHEIRTTTMTFASTVKFTAPAKDLIFLNRKLGGMFHLLKDLGVRADLNIMWQRMLSR